MINLFREAPFLIPLAFIGVVTFLLIVIWSIRRHLDPTLHVESTASIDELMTSMAGLTLTTAVAGNSVEVLENGAFFDVLLQRIRAAEKTVHFETFLWKEGVLGQRVADALSDRARAGLKVRVLLDATGSSKIGNAALKQMRDAGCRVVFFHKRAFRNVGVLNDRDHRKLVVIDGREAFVGGHCFVDTWLGDAQDGEHYSDLSVRVHGPVVNSVQAAFSENWVGETGELFDICQAGRVSSGREDPAPHRDLPGPQADLDPEPLLHPATQSDRRLWRSCQAWRRRPRADACHQRLRQPYGAARGPPQF